MRSRRSAANHCCAPARTLPRPTSSFIPPVDRSRRAAARAQDAADLLAGALADSESEAIGMDMASVRRRLAHLQAGQARLEAILAALQARLDVGAKVAPSGPVAVATVTNQSSSAAKLA